MPFRQRRAGIHRVPACKPFRVRALFVFGIIAILINAHTHTTDYCFRTRTHIIRSLRSSALVTRRDVNEWMNIHTHPPTPTLNPYRRQPDGAQKFRRPDMHVHMFPTVSDAPVASRHKQKDTHTYAQRERAQAPSLIYASYYYYYFVRLRAHACDTNTKSSYKFLIRLWVWRSCVCSCFNFVRPTRRRRRRRQHTESERERARECPSARWPRRELTKLHQRAQHKQTQKTYAQHSSICACSAHALYALHFTAEHKIFANNRGSLMMLLPLMMMMVDVNPVHSKGLHCVSPV